MKETDMKHRILVVDDNPDLVRISQKLLLEKGHEVITGHTGNECLDLARKHKPDLILLDNVLPDIHGNEVCSILKQDPETSNLFIVIVTASKTSEKDRVEGLEAGADGYIVRPLGNRRLMAQVDAMLRIKRTEESVRKKEMMLSSEKERAEFYLDLLCHDLRNIHQGISGALEISIKNLDDKEKLEPSLKLAMDAVNDSINLTSEVLLLSKIMKMDASFDIIDVDPSLTNAFENVKRMFPQKEIELEMELNGSKVMAEPLLQEVFINLFHNAVKLQGEKPFLGIHTSTDGECVSISVCDKGPGIPDEMKRILFKKYGIKGARTRTGLGISIVNQLVNRYNGKIEVSDRVQGDHEQGACFNIRFPLAG